MATLKTKTDTVENTATVETVNPDLVTIDKAGQAANARKAVQAYQRACSDYGSLIAQCGKSKHVNSSLSRKSWKVKELSELDCSTLSSEQVKRLSECIRIRKAWSLLTGEF